MTEKEVEPTKKRRGRPPKPKVHTFAPPDNYLCPQSGETYKQRHIGRCEGCEARIPIGKGDDLLQGQEA